MLPNHGCHLSQLQPKPHYLYLHTCPGPNIVNFSKVVSLQTMADHIYGRTNILTNTNRPHMFIAELNLYIDYLKEELTNELQAGLLDKKEKYYTLFCKNIREGIAYYRNLTGVAEANRNAFLNALDNAERELTRLSHQPALS